MKEDVGRGGQGAGGGARETGGKDGGVGVREVRKWTEQVQ